MRELHIKVSTPVESTINMKVHPYDTVYSILDWVVNHYGYALDGGHYALTLNGEDLNMNDTVGKLHLNYDSHLIFVDYGYHF